LTALDHEQIRQLLARYSHAIDFGDSSALAACFTPDGYFAQPGLPPEAPYAERVDGRAAIAAFATTLYANVQGHTRHWPSMPVIEGSGDDATGVLYVMVVRPGMAPNAGIVLTGVYHDEYTKIDGEWLFAAREFRADPQAEHQNTIPQDPLVRRYDDFVGGRIEGKN
jgi:hypothetical protein